MGGRQVDVSFAKKNPNMSSETTHIDFLDFLDFYDADRRARFRERAYAI
jgi:hypothetical protein